jgi:hypothetical protein
MKNKVYISGPMTGLPEYNYPAFHAAEIALRVHGYEPLSPARIDAGGQVQHWSWYMRRAVQMLMDADAVATLPGWQDSRGAVIEVNLALQLNMPVVDLHIWLGERQPCNHEWGELVEGFRPCVKCAKVMQPA